MMNECIANQCIENFDEMFEQVVARWQWMMDKGVEKIKGLTNYHWLPKAD